VIVLLVILEYMFDAIRVVDQVNGPEKQAYPKDITVVTGHFQSKKQRVVPNISRTPKQEMARRPWCHLVVKKNSAFLFRLYLKPKLPLLGQVQLLPQDW
jgi:CRISPR/Cas system CMR subunit Cmr6 (Cas7 group RAMP superfamily)